MVRGGERVLCSVLYKFGFVQRHPKYSLHTANTLSYCQSNAVDQESIDYYFSLLKKTLKGNNLMDQACYIYNMDEFGLQPIKVYCSKGYEKVYGPSSGNKSQITIHACANAVGTVLPPIIF